MSCSVEACKDLNITEVLCGRVGLETLAVELAEPFPVFSRKGRYTPQNADSAWVLKVRRLARRVSVD